MRKLQIRPKARADLLAIWDHIAADNVRAANKVIADLEEAIGGLPAVPGKGHSRADISNPRYRCWIVHSYVIVYEYDAAALTVVRVVHGRRNFRRLFRR